ncbi:MAG: RNA polymerase sigma factor, partial [Candidatus Sumerlaeota bacterium]
MLAKAAFSYVVIDSQIKLIRFMSPIRFTDKEVKQLLGRALSHDEDAWKELFQGLYGLLKSQALRAGLKNEDIDDSVGEILLSLVASPSEFQQARDTISYIAASAYFAALRHRKMRGRIAARETPVDLVQVPENEKHSRNNKHQQKEIMSAQIRSAVMDALMTIPDAIRRQMLLHYGEDFSYEEIGYVSGASPGGIRVAVHRAANRIRTDIEKQMREDLPEADLGRILRIVDLPAVVPDVDKPSADLLCSWISDPE